MKLVQIGSCALPMEHAYLIIDDNGTVAVHFLIGDHVWVQTLVDHGNVKALQNYVMSYPVG
jgi:hypothetical protein